MNFFHYLTRFRCDTAFCKFLPYILSRLVIRMHHIFCKKAIVTQVINYQFISREIMHSIKLVDKMMDRMKQHGLTAIVFYQSIAQMSYRAYSKNDVEPGIKDVKFINHFFNRCLYLLNG